jgi:Outer membrane protein beta-barrel domain
MKKSILIFGVVLLSAFTAAAQDIPKAETFFGYSYVRFNPSTSVIPSSNYNGGNAQAGYNFNKWLSAVVDLGAVHKSEIGVARVDSTLFNFVAGPRASMHYSRFKPYIQALFGGVYSTASTPVLGLVPAAILPALPGLPSNPVTPGTVIGARISASETQFAMLAGGGVDVKINKHVNFRPFEVSYYLTKLRNFRLPGDSVTQNNFRYSGGVSFTFGAQ